jgi:hypothetical protein
VENPEQQIGAGPVTLPSCCAGDIETQYNTGSNGTSVPDLMPDIVTRFAVNPGKAVHLGAGGVLRVFRHGVAPFTDTFREVGGGVSIEAALRVTTTTRVLLQTAFGSGLGRYVGGLAPDVAFDRDGSVSTIRTSSWVAGIEQKVFSRASVAGYYSGIVIENTFDRDEDGSFIGYGFPGSSNANNRKIHELTGTLSTLTMQTENRGSAQLGLQLSWLTREPWSRGNGPASASALLFFAQMRYNLP